MPRWADLALAAADALKRTAWRDGRLLATRRGDHADLNAYLDDHAFLLAALVELMQVRFRREDFDWARELADALLARFEDRERGGFFFTSHDHEKLFHRTKPGHDNATPSGNGVAAQALIALGHLAAEPRYVDAAERTVRLFAAGDRASRPAGIPRCSRPPRCWPRRRRSVLSSATPRDRARNGSARSPRVTARARSCSTCRRSRDVPARTGQRARCRREARSRSCAAARRACRRWPSLDDVLAARAARPVR